MLWVCMWCGTTMKLRRVNLTTKREIVTCLCFWNLQKSMRWKYCSDLVHSCAQSGISEGFPGGCWTSTTSPYEQTTNPTWMKLKFISNHWSPSWNLTYKPPPTPTGASSSSKSKTNTDSMVLIRSTWQPLDRCGMIWVSSARSTMLTQCLTYWRVIGKVQTSG